MIRKFSTDELIKQKGDLKNIHSCRNEIFLILDNIRSMHNVGAIFRTADAAKIKKLYLCGITAYPPRKEIEKTALKTIEYVPWEYREDTTDLIKKLKDGGIKIIALEQTDKSIDFNKFKFEMPLAIVAGNEVDGVNSSVLKLCDAIINIPMFGIANSLNVTTAIGIVLYRALNHDH